MMNMQSKNQYLKVLRKGYLKTKEKLEKSKLLDEAEKRTGLNRKYLVRKLRPKSNLDKIESERKKRKPIYSGDVKATLVKCWKIFDYPCGQRLKSSLETEVDRLKKFVGYLRYDSEEELKIINDLYCNELRFYKNFFQPAMKLVSKERVGGKIKRKYDKPKTPYQRIMESKDVSREEKHKLKPFW